MLGALAIPKAAPRRGAAKTIEFHARIVESVFP
jgi:hypothetical protein